MKQTLQTATLDNGITLLGEFLPGVESVSVSFHVAAGSLCDSVMHSATNRSCCGLATLTGELMLRGAGNRNSKQLVASLDNAGVQWSQSVSMSHGSFAGAMVSRQLPESLEIYADILRRPLLDKQQFDPARQVVLQNLAGTEDDPTHRTMLALREAHYPSPWGLPSEGTTVDVNNLQHSDVQEFVNRFIQPQDMIISVAGRLNWLEFTNQMDSLFGDWQGQSREPVINGERGKKICHVPYDSQQTHIALAWDVPPYRNPDSLQATAALAVLGGGSSSRLFTEVREKRGLCYSVSAGYQTQRDIAAAMAYSGTTADRAQETLDVMLHEIASLPGTITNEELDRVKARAKSGLVMQQESTAARAGAMARQWFHLGRIRSLAEDLERLDNLTVESIEHWLAQNPLTEVTTVFLGRNPLEVPDAVSP
ncbi:MAG: insulinase family protein [Planctomycetaceae bacterium]|nr:insulinase family protein [Planctomycetaceae bacterium]